MSMADDQYDAGPPGAPHLLLLAVVVGVGLLVAWPLFLGGSREAVIDVIANAIAELLGPVGLLLLPLGLLLLIHLLSSDGGSPDAVYHVGGSPIGVALMLVLILALLYYRSALFGSGGDDDK